MDEKLLNLVLSKLKTEGVTDITNEEQVNKALKNTVSPSMCKKILYNLKEYNDKIQVPRK